jgi:addiction module HigA family antidote
MIRIPTDRAPTHPGTMLQEEFLRPLGLTQRELASRLEVSYPRVSEIVHGRRGVTPDTALRLERLLGVEAEFWLNLQLAWDLYHVRRSAAGRRIRRITRLPRRRAPNEAAGNGVTGWAP